MEISKEILDKAIENTEKEIEKAKEQFKNYNYNGSREEELLNWVAEGKSDNGIWSDDFCYGKDWEQKVPEYCRTPEKFYEVIGKLEELFSSVCYFHEDVKTDLFPEQRIFVRIPNKVALELSYVVGQGSDFGIFIVSNEQNCYFIFDWNDLIKVAKMSVFEQAEWYLNNVINKKLDETDYKKALFALGQGTIRLGFFERLNDNNIDEILESL